MIHFILLLLYFLCVRETAKPQQIAASVNSNPYCVCVPKTQRKNKINAYLNASTGKTPRLAANIGAERQHFPAKKRWCVDLICTKINAAYNLYILACCSYTTALASPSHATTYETHRWTRCQIYLKPHAAVSAVVGLSLIKKTIVSFKWQNIFDRNMAAFAHGNWHMENVCGVTPSLSFNIYKLFLWS